MTTDNLLNRKALSLSLVTRLGGDPSPEILQKVTSCLIEWTKRLHRNWLEDTLIPKPEYLAILSSAARSAAASASLAVAAT